MKKKIRIFGIIILLLMVVLSGCNEETEINDRDGDGYLDEIDDFPDDINLHKKIIWHQFENKELTHNTSYPSKSSSLEISSDVKYVEWTWSLVNFSNLEAKIEFKMARMVDNYLFVMYKLTGRVDSNRIYVDSENIGIWSCTWDYTTMQDYGKLFLSATVYIVK